jgi:phosphoglycerate dehydrogenase-like enzyme
MGTQNRVALVSALARVGREHLEPLESRFELAERYELDNTRDEDILEAGLRGAWGVVAGSEGYAQGTFGRLPDLRVIARCGVGVDAIDLEAATAHGVIVATTPDANSDGVADLTLALMLACLRRLLVADRSARIGAWRPPGLAADLSCATVGLIGLGRIGRQVARRLSGFGCRLLAVEPDPHDDFCRSHAVELVELETLLPQVDVLSIHVPLTEHTRGLIGRREIGLMKPSAILINTSRGAILDEQALIEALTERRLAGAGLDVFATEPLAPDHRLAACDNVILSPHAGSLTPLSVSRTLRAVCTNLIDASRGRIPTGCVNPNARRPHQRP